MKTIKSPWLEVARRIAAVFLVTLLCAAVSTGCRQGAPERWFRFVFMTDIHVNDERMAPEGLRAAVAHAETFEPDFVITGGDLIMDALEVPLDEAVAQYELYNEIIGSFEVPVYNALGNHGVFGLSEESGVAPEHPQYGKAMFKQMLGLDSTYYSFDHGGWHFIVLDAMAFTEDRDYFGEIDSGQMAWLKDDLGGVKRETPIVVVTHFPFVSVAMQLREGGAAALPEAAVIVNSHEAYELFKGYNLRLVLQGHLHTVEETIVGDVHFVTGGAVSGRWWGGPNAGFAEGFVVVDLSDDDFAWRYETYGWRAVVAE
jgi:3',5'-cyclic AMP phosphodiesterase CpdA